MESNVNLLLALLSVIIATVGVAVSIVVWLNGKRKSRVEYSLALQNSWNQYNLAVLNCEENLRIAEWLSSYDSEPLEGVNEIRCKYLAFLKLNAINLAFLAGKEGVGDEGYTSQNINQLLPPMLLKAQIFELTQRKGYSPAFAEKCKEIRENPPFETLEGISKYKEKFNLSSKLDQKTFPRDIKQNKINSSSRRKGKTEPENKLPAQKQNG